MDNTEFDRRALLGAAGLAGFAALATNARGGSIAPPAGPVLATMKTIEEAEPRDFIEQTDIPYTITRPGSYYLRENLSAVGLLQFDMITVLADNVTIDLRGFTIAGATEVSLALHGIKVNSGVSGVRVHSGNIVRCSQNGVFANGATHCVLEDLCVLQSGNEGIEVGDGSTVARCLVAQSAWSGIRTSKNAQVLECASIGNGQSGVSADDATLVKGCFVNDNGLYGIALTSQCSAVGNTLLRNAVGAQSSFPAIIAFGGTTNGLIDGNFLAENQYGIAASGPGNAGWTIVRNVVKASLVANYGVGPGNHLGTIVASPAGAGAWDNLSL